MLNRIMKTSSSDLDALIAKIIARMETEDPGSEEYSKLMNNLTRLKTLKAETTRGRVSPDTMFIVGGNLIGIVIIVAYERGHVMVSKALSLAFKAKS